MIKISIRSLLDKARELLGVDGAYVGIVGEPGEFFNLALKLIDKGEKKDFLTLLREENPATRAMGIVCLARTEGIDSKKLIKPYLKDRTFMLVIPGGCTLNKITLGSLVWEIFNNLNYLGFDLGKKLLLPQNELISFNLEILIEDQYTSFHWKASKKLVEDIKNNLLTLDISSLKSLHPSLELADILKGIGRIEGNDQIRNFLINIVKNEKLKLKARLTAASALTRVHNQKIFNLLKDMEQTFNGYNNDGGTILVQSLHLKEEINSITKILFQEKSWEWMETHKKKYIDLISVPHPSTLYYIKTYCLSYIDSYPEMKEIIIDRLLKFVDLTEKYNQSWNTFSNLVYEIEDLIYGTRETSIKKLFPEYKYSEFIKLIKEHTRN